jgi:shikimate 5-dehydrogenase
VATAEAAGCRAEGGQNMLLAQAVATLGLWIGNNVSLRRRVVASFAMGFALEDRLALAPAEASTP